MIHEWAEALATAAEWQSQGFQVVQATVIKTWGSAPRRPGSLMLISQQGAVWGSVSAGCVEAAVIEVAMAVVQTQQPQLLHFGVANDQAWQVGLMCGGEIEVFVQPWNTPAALVLAEQLAFDQSWTWQTMLVGAHVGAQQVWQAGVLLYSSLPKSSEPFAESHWFVQVYEPPPELIIVGGNQLGVALAHQALLVGYAVVVIEPRALFAQSARFPDQVTVLHAWPDDVFAQWHFTPHQALAVLSHDPKFDDLALYAALHSSIGYIGALGSRRTQAERRERLLAHGCSYEDIERIHGPIGLDIGAQTPQEIAVSVMAEIIAFAHQVSLC